MLECKIADNESDYKTCLDIRNKVFIVEQNVSPDIEIDSLESVAIHFLTLLNGEPVGTARFVKMNETAAKIGRVAVLKEHRGKNIGKLMMQEVTNYAKSSGISSLLLGSQTHALDFYRKLGFKEYGKEFMDADIPHYMMRLDFNTPNSITLTN